MKCCMKHVTTRVNLEGKSEKKKPSKWKKLDTKGPLSYDSIYTKCLRQAHSEIESRSVDSMG